MSPRRPSLGAIFLTVLIDLLGFGLVMPFLALQARDTFGISEGSAAMLGASYSLMQFVFMPLWGRLSDRIGRRPVLLTSIAFSALSMAGLGLALGWSQTILWVFVARIMSGVSTANLGTASAYIADITRPEERVKGMGMIGMAFGIGFILGPGLGGVLSGFEINGRSGAVACFVAAGLSVVNLVWVWFGVPESLPAEKRKASTPRPLRPLDLGAIRESLARPSVARTITLNLGLVLAFSSLEQVYAFYASDRFALDQADVGYLFVFMGLTAAVIQGGLMRRVSGKIPEPVLIRWGVALQVLAYIGFVIAPTLGLAWLYLSSALLATGNGISQPSISAQISRAVPASEQGTTLSSNQSFSSLGRTLGPAGGGLLYQGYGSVAPFVACAALAVGSLTLATGLRRPAHGGAPARQDESGVALLPGEPGL